MLYRYAKGLPGIYNAHTITEWVATATSTTRRLFIPLLFSLISFVLHCASCLPLFSFALNFSFRSAWKGFTYNDKRVRCALYFSFLFVSVPIVNCPRKNARKSCRSSHTQSNAQKRRKSRKIVERRHEIFERFMNLCICYTLCCAKTSCFGIRRAVFVVFLSPFGLLTHNKEATAKKIAWITLPKIT